MIQLVSAVTRFQPRAELRDRVASIEVILNADDEHTILPSSSAVLGVQVSGRVRGPSGLLSTAGVTGLQECARTYAYVGATTSLLVRFTPQGAACLGVPASTLTSRNVGLDDFLKPARVREMHERVGAAPNDAARVAALEDFLVALPFEDDPLVARALELVAPSTGDVRVAVVARSLGLSERQLERRFLQRVGITPKRFATLLRFERALALARTAPSLTAAALDAGYYDQSHFIRDFRRFAGIAPGELLRVPR